MSSECSAVSAPRSQSKSPVPEGDYRRWLAERARILATDSFGLIKHYGRDIAGAVQFLPEGEHPADDAHWAIESLASDQLDQMVADLPLNPFAIIDESELSLPGLRAKMLLVAQGDGAWARPLGGRPSTHILKRDSDRHPGVVAAECDALALSRHVGLTTVNAHIERHGDYDCILVERFDRVIDDAGNVTGRVHQEDACQALGLAPTQKYELHHGGGGPTFQQVAALIDRYSGAPAAELDELTATGMPITFAAIADRAAISCTTLYRDPQLRTVIEEHKYRSHYPRTLTSLATENRTPPHRRRSPRRPSPPPRKNDFADSKPLPDAKPTEHRRTNGRHIFSGPDWSDNATTTA